MKNSSTFLSSDSRLQSLAKIVDKMANQLRANRPIDVDAYAESLPGLEQEIRDTYESLLQIQRLRDISPETTAAADDDQPESLPAHHVIGEYRILHELGRGGMGVVYEAEQLSLGRRVALKVLPFAALLDPNRFERFRNEARAAAMLKHPNIVGVHSVGCEKGVHYYAMDLVEGQSLSDVIAGLKSESRLRSPSNNDSDSDSHVENLTRAETSPLARLSTEHSDNRQSFFRSVAKLGIQAANALHFAHLAGVLHRDIKPSNLLLDRLATIQIADFGLARIQTADSLTMTGDMVGTLRYMSPEQVEGHVTDERTDVYSLGATLFELLTLRSPFVEENRNPLMRAILDSPAPSPKSISRDIPSDLSNIVGKCLQKSPDERYGSAEEFADDLQRFLDNRSIKAKPTTHVQRMRYFARRNPTTAWLLGLTFCLLSLLGLGSSAVAWKFFRDANIQSTQLRQQQLVAYARDMQLAKIAIEKGAYEEGQRRLLNWVPNKGPDDRGMEWYFLWRLGHPTDLQQSITHETYADDVAFSPDGRLLADAFGSDTVPIWDLTKPGSEPVKVLPCKKIEIFVSETFARGDDHVLVVGDKTGNVYIWDWESLEPIVEPLVIDSGTSQSSVCSVDVDSTGKYVAIGAYGADRSGHVEVFEIDQRRRLFSKSLRTGNASVGFDTHGRLIVACQGDRNVEVFDVPSGELVASHEVDGLAGVAAISHDRKKLAINVERQMGSHSETWVEVRELSDWSDTFRFHLPQVKVRSLGFSHNGETLGVGGYDGRLWQANLRDGTVASRLLHEGQISSVNFSPNDSMLATTGLDTFIHLLSSDWPKVPTAEPIIRCPEIATNSAKGVAFPDDRTVCTSREDRFVDIWNAETGERIDVLELKPGIGTQVRLDAHRGRGLLAAGQTQWPTIEGKPGRVTIWQRVGDSMTVLREDVIPKGVLSISMPFSPDGRYLAVCGKHIVTVIDTINPQSKPREIRFDSGWVKSCAFSPDGKTLACAGAGDKTYFLDVETLKPVREPFVTDATFADCIAYLPGTNHLAVVGFDHELKIFDVKTGELVRKSERYPNFFATVRASPDGSRLGVGGMDGKFRVFRTEDCQELINFEIPCHYSYCDFSADGQSLAIAAGGDAFVVRGTGADELSEMTVTELKDIACANLRVLLRD